MSKRTPSPKADDSQVEEAQALPDLVILERDFGFSLNGVLRVWAAQIPIIKPADIRELIANDAPLKAYREV